MSNFLTNLKAKFAALNTPASFSTKVLVGAAVVAFILGALLF